MFSPKTLRIYRVNAYPTAEVGFRIRIRSRIFLFLKLEKDFVLWSRRLIHVTFGLDVCRQKCRIIDGLDGDPAYRYKRTMSRLQLKKKFQGRNRHQKCTCVTNVHGICPSSAGIIEKATVSREPMKSPHISGKHAFLCKWDWKLGHSTHTYLTSVLLLRSPRVFLLLFFFFPSWLLRIRAKLWNDFPLHRSAAER